MSEAPPRLTILIPAYNEEPRIEATLDHLSAYLAERDYDGQIVVADDGSTDRTADIVREKYPNVGLVSYSPNRGKGFAVKAALEKAEGEFVLMYDADGSTPIEEVAKVWPLVDDGADLVIGSRALPDSDIAVRQPWYRQRMGRFYNVLLKLLVLTPFPDTQCGFKAFRRTCAEDVFPLQVMEGFGADAEVLWIAQHRGWRVEQVPVRWVNSPDSSVHVIFDSLKMIREAFMIRLNTFTRSYR